MRIGERGSQLYKWVFSESSARRYQIVPADLAATRGADGGESDNVDNGTGPSGGCPPDELVTASESGRTSAKPEATRQAGSEEFHE